MVDALERINGLDLLRTLAMLLGVALHATLPYMLAAEAIAPPEWVFLLFVSIHTWRMPLFFMLAGFFGAMSLRRKTIASFCWDRFYRITLPLLLFLPIFQMQQFVKGLNGDWSDTSLLHLWFLFYLSIFYIMPVTLGQCVPNRVAECFDFFFRSRVHIFALIPFLTVASVLGRDLAIFGRVPENITEFGLGHFVYGFCFFVMGWRLFLHRKLLQTFTSLRFVCFSLLTALLFLISVLIVLSILEFQINNGWTFWVLNFLSVSATLLTCIGFWGLCHRIMIKPSPIVDFAVEISYPIYYFHLIIMLPLLYYFFDNGWAPQATVSISFVFGLFGSLVIYLIFIRYTPLNWMFNGYKNSWCQTAKFTFRFNKKN